VYTGSSTYDAIAINGYDRIRLDKRQNLEAYHTRTSDRKIQKQKSQYESALTAAELERKNLLVSQTLKEFEPRGYFSKQSKRKKTNNAEVLRTGLGFSFGLERFNFKNDTALRQTNLDQTGRTMLSANGGSARIMLTLRGIVTFYYAPGIYRGEYVYRYKNPGQNSNTYYETTKTNWTYGYSFGFLLRFFPFSPSEALVIGAGIANINRSSRGFLSAGILFE
jgi:hypothetical protein